MLVIRILFLIFLLAACNAEHSSSTNSYKVELQLLNLPVDSCTFRINHIITGEEVYCENNVDLSKPIEIPTLRDDMYIAVFSWPRTLVSHHVLKNKQFDKDSDEDLFQLTKPLYVNSKNGSQYRIRVSNAIGLEELEAQGAEILDFENIGCKECDLADAYWSLFGTFFDRKNRRIDSAKQAYYDYIRKDDLQNGNKAFLALEEIKTYFLKDDILDHEIQEMVRANPNSQVSTFFLFYQLYNHREFDKYESTYKLLKNDAQHGKYYRMVKNQFLN